MFLVAEGDGCTVEFRLDDSQIGLQETVARFCADRFALDSIAARAAGPTDLDRWKDMAELGMFGLLLPEADGGSGLGILEAVLLFEQLGSYLVDGPALWTVLGASLVEGAASGDQLVGGVAHGSPDEGRLVVEHAAEIDTILVVVGDDVVAHSTAELPAPTPLEPLDPLTTIGMFTGLRTGRIVGGAEAAARMRELGTVLSAALLLGVASRGLEVARSYALEREQFGVPIGSFQAIKHILADMYVRTVLAQSATYAASAVLDDAGRDDAMRAAATAKLVAGDAAIANASSAVQVLGGMGFTWDMLPNYLLKRAWVLEQGFGTADDHAMYLGSTMTGSTIVKSR
jgi:alkylation response protein AidB-like acyl-CoA dehydrogenase